MTTCKTCGTEVAKSASTCPKCGAKLKKKHPILVILLVIVVLAVIGSALGGGSQSSTSSTQTNKGQTSPTAEPTPISYTHYNVTELFDVLKENAMKAKETFKGQYVELEGYLGVIDSSGKYIGLDAGDNMDYFLEDIQCFIKSDEQKKIIMDLKSGDKIVVRGKITDVGEVLGYTLNIDSIN